MNLTIFTREYPPIILGGVGNTARFLSEELTNSGFNVNIVTPKFGKYVGLPSIEKNKNITIYRIPIRNRLLFWYKSLFFSLSRKKLMKQTDLIHVLNARDAPFIYKKCPMIVNINDYIPSTIPLNPFKYPYKEKNKFLKYFHYQFEKFLDYVAVRRADIILTTAKYTKDAISKTYKIPDRKAKVLYKGIDVDEFNKKINKDIDILLVGSPLGSKGATELLESVKILKSKYKKIRCVMVGRLPKAHYDYNTLVKKFKLEENIIIIESMPHEELINYYLRSKIFVLPSYRESLPQAIMEAMAAKLPVIATNLGGISEIVTKETGFLIEPQKVRPLAEKIDFLLSNPKIAEEMGAKGYERVKKYFDFNRMIKEYMKVYEEFVKNG